MIHVDYMCVRWGGRAVGKREAIAKITAASCCCKECVNALYCLAPECGVGEGVYILL